jgi:host factor-I protein
VSELDLNSPSTRLFQRLIRDQITVHLKTQAGEAFSGKLRWQDSDCLCLVCDKGELIFWRTSLAYLKTEQTPN